MNPIVDQLQLDQQIVAAGRILAARAMRGVRQPLEVARPAVVLEHDVAVQLFDRHRPKVYQRPRKTNKRHTDAGQALRCGLKCLILLSVLLLSGCAGVVARPMIDPGVETRPVFLLDHGRHASLVLTRADDSLVRYVHGDWVWYAEDRTGPLRAFPTLLLPTESAVGRRELAPARDENELRRRIRVGIETIYSLSAPAAKIDALDQSLSEWFERKADEALFNARFDLEFVPGPRPYTLFDNSNHVVAEWLEALGIPVRGNPIFGHWRLQKP